MQVGAQAHEVRHQRLAAAVRRRRASHWNSFSVRELPLELLEHIRAHIAAGRDRQDVDQARHGRAAAPGARHLVVVERLVVEEIQAQEGAHPLVQRLLEDQHFAGRPRRRWQPRVRPGVRSCGVLCLTRAPSVNGASSMARCRRRPATALEIAARAAPPPAHCTRAHVGVVADDVVARPSGVPRAMPARSRIALRLLERRAVARLQAADLQLPRRNRPPARDRPASRGASRPAAE